MKKPTAKEERTERIEKVGKWFKDKAPEFAKSVAPIYQLLQWKWTGEIPNEGRILQSIESKIDGLVKDLKQDSHRFEQDYNISSGGIEVGYIVSEMGIDPYISFTFKVSDFDL